VELTGTAAGKPGVPPEEKGEPTEVGDPAGAPTGVMYVPYKLSTYLFNTLFGSHDVVSSTFNVQLP